MSLNLNQEIWVYVERLYTHCYNPEEFKIFLKKYNIDYDNVLFARFNETTTLYTFMSEPNYDFANLMQTVPTYKYLPILEKIVFDEKILGTRKDGWNYYGAYIKDWHPKIVDILRVAGVTIDLTKKKLTVLELEEQFEGPDFLPYDFSDLFLDYIRKEINESYSNGQLLAVIILSRKLLEALVIRILEVVFPKMLQGSYNQQNHDLWYDRTRNRFHGLETLLTNFETKSVSFDEDKELVQEVCGAVKRIKNEANDFVHRDYKIPNEKYLKSLNIESTTVSLRKLYKKYCNP